MKARRVISPATFFAEVLAFLARVELHFGIARDPPPVVCGSVGVFRDGLLTREFRCGVANTRRRTYGSSESILHDGLCICPFHPEPGTTLTLGWYGPHATAAVVVAHRPRAEPTV